MYIRRLRWSKEILKDLDLAGVDISEITEKQFLRICNSILVDENDGLKYLELFFNTLCELLSIKIDGYPMLSEHYVSFLKALRIE